ALADEGSDRVILGFRPEAVDIVGDIADGDGEVATFPVTVTVVEELGSDAFLYGQYADTTDPALLDQTVIARVDPNAPPAKGDRVRLRIVPGKEQLFSAVTHERLPN
ncbi:MAG: TOBE domain-containing protein, partial [Mycobacterium leprae]